MILDKQLELSSAQAVTAAAASTNYIDLGVARDIGITDDLYLVIVCNTTTVSAGSTTCTFKLQSDDNTSFSSAIDRAVSAAIAKATLVAGYQLIIKIPPGTNERYLRLYYDVAVADFSAGAFSAYVTNNIHKQVIYPDAL